MRAIFAVGNGSEELIAEASAELEKRQIPFVSISPEDLCTFCDGRHVVGSAIDGDGDVAEVADDLILISTDLIPCISGAVIVLCSDSYYECDYDVKGVVVASGNTAISRGLKRVPLISCGMSGKETVTFSSICDDDAIICLQRRIVTVSGRVIEPQEFVWSKPQRDIFLSLSVFAALLLSDVV